MSENSDENVGWTEKAKHLPRNRVGLASLWDGAIKWLGGRG